MDFTGSLHQHCSFAHGVIAAKLSKSAKRGADRVFTSARTVCISTGFGSSHLVIVKSSSPKG